MKQFMVFMGYVDERTYVCEPHGWAAFRGDFETFDDALRYVKNHLEDLNWAEIVNMKSKEKMDFVNYLTAPMNDEVQPDRKIIDQRRQALRRFPKLGV